MALKIQPFLNSISRLSKREKLVFYVSFFFICITILDRFIISPIFSELNSLDKQIDEKKATVKKNLKIVAQKDRIQAISASYGTFSNSAESDDEQMTSFLKEIETIANKDSVYLVDVKPSNVKVSRESVRKYLVNLNCEAQMEQILGFMYDIESSEKLLMIERYQISPKSQESSVIQCTMVVSKMVI